MPRRVSDTPASQSRQGLERGRLRRRLPAARCPSAAAPRPPKPRPAHAAMVSHARRFAAYHPSLAPARRSCAGAGVAQRDLIVPGKAPQKCCVGCIPCPCTTQTLLPRRSSGHVTASFPAKAGNQKAGSQRPCRSLHRSKCCVLQTRPAQQRNPFAWRWFGYVHGSGFGG